MSIPLGWGESNLTHMKLMHGVTEPRGKNARRLDYWEVAKMHRSIHMRGGQNHEHNWRWQ